MSKPIIPSQDTSVKRTDETPGDYVIEAEEALVMLGEGYEEVVRIKDDSKDHKYFTITPRIVKAFSRNAHDFAFWDTVKDVAGESGECFLNTDQLAILSGISTGQASNSRTYWIKIGFLKGEIKKDPGYSQAVWHLTVPDLWQRNIEWCEKYPKIAARLEFRKSHRSLHRMKASGSEGKPSGGETKKSIKEDLINKRFAKIQTALEKIGILLTSSDPMLIDTWLEQHPDEWIQKAIDITKAKNIRNIKYPNTILAGWLETGYPKGKPNATKQANQKQSDERTPEAIASDEQLAEQIYRARYAPAV